ncbi:MAG TPA: hypothetical protein VHL11_22560, partial [Phototrophicaceae bacterium]|nr:hypothetical protein [Phototrophicaceae bacterium]
MNKSGSIEETTARKVLFLNKTVSFKTAYSKLECISLVEQPIPEWAWKRESLIRFPPEMTIKKDGISENVDKVILEIPLLSLSVEILISSSGGGSNVKITIRSANKAFVMFAISLPFIYAVIQNSEKL